MRSVLPMRAAKIGYIVMSAALCVLGILLICLPEVFSGLIGVLIGIILIVFGAVRMAGYFSKDLYRLAFQHDLTSGIILIALGVIVLITPASLIPDTAEAPDTMDSESSGAETESGIVK